MADIIKFPKVARAVPNQEPPDEPAPSIKERPRPVHSGSVVKMLWVATVLLWPWVRWFVVLDVLFQFGRMVYHWNTPGTFAGWTFLLHFGVLTAITYFVSVFKLKGL